MLARNPGMPRGFGVFFAVLFPLIIAGPIRAITKLDLWTTFAMSLVLVGVGVALLRRAQSQLPSQSSWFDFALWSVSALVAVLTLFNRDFAGLVNYVGGDGGVHVHHAREFAKDNPGVYSGFVSMYGFTALIERFFRCNAFWSFCAAFYVVVAVVASTPIAVASITFHSSARRDRRLALGLTFFVALAIQFTLVWPLLQYAQEDGFYSHLFGLIPLMLLWLADVAFTDRRTRIFALLAMVGLYRYTYGLNLPDLLVTLAAVVALDAIFARWTWKLGALVLCAGLLYAARYGYLGLETLWSMWGWYVGYDTVQAETVHALSLVAVFVLWLLSRCHAPLGRAMRLPWLFALCNLVVYGLIRRRPTHEWYYLYKYNVHAIVLLASVLPICVASTWLHGVKAAPRASRIAFGAIGALLVILVMTKWIRVFEVYQPRYRERISGGPYAQLYPQADLGAWSRIERVLADEKKQFGGYLTAHWPMFNFMNAGLGYYNGGRQFWDRGKPNTDSGNCVFWETPYFGEQRFFLRSIRDSLHSERDKSCISYRAHWNPTGPQRTLCHVCF